MKTAISLPDAVFEQAERMAKDLELTRSELYSRALAEYLARHAPERVTAALDELCDELDTRGDDFSRRAARQALGHDEW